MRLKIILVLVVAGATLAWQAGAQIYDTNNVVVQTFAGSGFSGHLDGQGTLTMFNKPSAIVADPSNNLFVLDSENFRIRKITASRIVSTFAGGGGGSLPGYGTNVSLPFNFGSMAIDHSNALWVMAYEFPTGRDFLLKIGEDAYISKVRENHGYYPLDRYGTYIGGLCVDSANNIYFSDFVSNKVYRLPSSGIAEVYAGSGNVGAIDGNWVFSSFNGPAALACDAANNVYVWDSGNKLIRRINPNRDVVTIAGGNGNGVDIDGVGTNAGFKSVFEMCVDNNGNVLIGCVSSIRKMTASTNVTTIAGSFTTTGYTNGVGSIARFRSASGVTFSQGAIFVSDKNDHRIRNITFDPAPELVSGANLSLNTYPGLQITGVIGRTYRIESSADMSAWNTEASILLTRSPCLWIDPNALGQKKFYRAFLLP